MSNKPDMNPTEVAKELRALNTESQKTAAQQAKVLSRPDTPAPSSEDPQIAQTAETQKASLQSAVKEAAVTKQIKQRVPRTPQERAVDTVQKYLDIFKNAKVGSPDKVDALQRIVTVVTRTPKNNVLNTILKFFKENQDAEWLGPMQALQGTTALDKSTSVRVRLLYETMMQLASGRASRKTISLDMIRNIFESDDFVNWLAVTMSRPGVR